MVPGMGRTVTKIRTVPGTGRMAAEIRTVPEMEQAPAGIKAAKMVPKGKTKQPRLLQSRMAMLELMKI